MAEDEKFLDRWSRRKVEAKTAPDPEDNEIARPELVDEAAAPAQEIAAVDPDAAAEGDETGEEIPPEIADIDIDALDYDSDFTVFMKDNVPEVIRRRALRQLWRSNPVLANVDGLNDYDEDFTDAALVVKGLKSAYQVGKGYLLDDEDEADEEAVAGAADGAEEQTAQVADNAGAEDAEDPPETDDVEGLADDDLDVEDLDEDDIDDPTEEV